MGEWNRGVTPSFLMDEREQAGEGGCAGERERKRAVTGIQTPAENSLAQNACFVICDVTATSLASTETCLFFSFFSPSITPLILFLCSLLLNVPVSWQIKKIFHHNLKTHRSQNQIHPQESIHI